MRLIIILAFLIFALHAFAGEQDGQLLKKMQEQVVKEQTEKTESEISSANVPEAEQEKEEEKRISVSVELRQCVDQGHTREECDLLTRDKQQTDNYYDIKNPRVPSLSEAKDDLFINLKIRN